MVWRLFIRSIFSFCAFCSCSLRLNPTSHPTCSSIDHRICPRVDVSFLQVLTVKYPSEVSWDHDGHDGMEQGDDQGRTGCDAEVTVCATNRLAGPGDNAKVNFTFEVSCRRCESVEITGKEGRETRV